MMKKAKIAASAIGLLGAAVFSNERYPLWDQTQTNQYMQKFDTLTILSIHRVEHLLGQIRDKKTEMTEFRSQSDRLMRLLIEEALTVMPKKNITRSTPLGEYNSQDLADQENNLCFVSIIRSGNAFFGEALRILPQASIGQILIQRDEVTALPKFYYAKLPNQINTMKVLLVDPMLATGGSASMVIDLLLKKGVQEENIVFINLIACPEGVEKIITNYPKIKLITASVDPTLLKPSCYIAPGLGDFGDRYFGTQH